MKKILREVFDFIKNPTDQRIENRSFKKNLKYFFSIYILDIILNVTIFLPILVFTEKYIVSLVMESRINYRYNTLPFIVITIGLIAPIIEELIFRLPLRYYKLFSFFISKDKWKRNFKYFIYISIITFGLIHSLNYSNSPSLIFFLFIPILVISQLLSGAILSFLRVRFNLLSSILYHSLWNLTLILVMFFSSIWSKPYLIEKNHYSIEIKTVPFNTKHGQFFSIDSSSNRFYNINLKEYSINHTLDSLFNYKRHKEDFLIDFHLKSTEGLSKKKVKEILLDYEKDNSF